MKRFLIIDILFIVVSSSILVLLNQYGYGSVLANYSGVVALAGYFIGKIAGRYEIIRRMKE